HRPAGPGRDGRLQVFPATGPGVGRPGPGSFGWLCVPDRNELQVLAQRGQDHGNPDHLRGPSRRGLQDEPAHRVGGRLDGLVPSHHGSPRPIRVDVPEAISKPRDARKPSRARRESMIRTRMDLAMAALALALVTAPAEAARWDTFTNANDLNAVRWTSRGVWAASDHGLHLFDPSTHELHRWAKSVAGPRSHPTP